MNISDLDNCPRFSCSSEVILSMGLSGDFEQWLLLFLASSAMSFNDNSLDMEWLAITLTPGYSLLILFRIDKRIRDNCSTDQSELQEE